MMIHEKPTVQNDNISPITSSCILEHQSLNEHCKNSFILKLGIKQQPLSWY